MKGKLIKIFYEMIPVVLGILIALILNNWKEERADKHFVSTVIRSTTQEIIENKATIEETIPEHKRLIDSISHYKENQMISIQDIIRKVESIRAPRIKNTSWKSFLNPNLKLVRYEIISELTNIEEGKQSLDKKTDNMMRFVYENMESTASGKKETFSFIIIDFLNAEENLLASHNDYLKAVKSSR